MRIRRHILLPFVFAALAACSAEPDPVEIDPSTASSQENDLSVTGDASSDPVPDQDLSNETAGTPDPYASGRPGQPAIPETVEDPAWTNRYSPDVPYYNRSDNPIPATMGASPRTALVGQVMPGDGGFIQTCELNSTYCQITFGGEGKVGYVNMDLMSGEAR